MDLHWHRPVLVRMTETGRTNTWRALTSSVALGFAPAPDLLAAVAPTLKQAIKVAHREAYANVASAVYRF
jgi:hypothetical protein